MSLSFTKPSALPAKFGQLLRLLREDSGISGAKLAQELKVEPRSIRRYITELREGHGIPVIHDKAKGGYRLTGTTPALPSQLHFTPQEAQALAVSAAALRGLLASSQSANDSGGMAAQLDALVDRLAAFLSPTQSQRTKSALACVDVVTSPLPARGDVWLAPLIEAILAGTRLHLGYRNKHDDAYTVAIDPYHLRHVHGAWYLVARDVKAREWKVYSLARIQELAPAGDLFTRRLDFDPKQYFEGVLGVFVTQGPLRPIRVRFTGFAALRVRECVLPKGFSLTEEKKRGKTTGAWLLAGKLRNAEDLRPWVNGWGDEAQWL